MVEWRYRSMENEDKEASSTLGRRQRAIENALGTNQLAQFVVFAGHDTEGMRESAQTIARMLLCTHATKRPCRRCDSCTIPLQRHPDYFLLRTEETEASVKIEHAKALLRFASKSAMLGGWRVAVIEQGDELTNSAANAMLKMLEEPPKDLSTILIVSSPTRILPTIRSRSALFRFPALRKTVRDHKTIEATQSDIQRSLEAVGSSSEALGLLGRWQVSLWDKLRELLHQPGGHREAFCAIAATWGDVERARRRLRANVHPRLVIESLLFSHH